VVHRTSLRQGNASPKAQVPKRWRTPLAEHHLMAALTSGRTAHVSATGGKLEMTSAAGVKRRNRNGHERAVRLKAQLA
jgi:hypothetical protein